MMRKDLHENRSAADWRQALDHLRGKLAKAEAKVGNLEQRRAPEVLAAQLGDAPAKARLAKLDDQRAAAERDTRDLGTAITEAEAALRDAEQAEAERRRVEDLVEARELEGTAAKLAARVDERLAGLKATVTEVKKSLVRAAVLRGHRSTGRVVTRLRGAFDRALAHHGLPTSNYVPTAQRGTFVGRLGAMLGVPEPAAEDEREAA